MFQPIRLDLNLFPRRRNRSPRINRQYCDIPGAWLDEVTEHNGTLHPSFRRAKKDWLSSPFLVLLGFWTAVASWGKCFRTAAAAVNTDHTVLADWESN